MRTILRAALVLAVFAAGAAAADAGPVKHWAQLPGRAIRTVALRGDMAHESVMEIVPGADGWIYMRGKNAVYRLLGTDGAFTSAAFFDWCDDRQARAVVPYPTPAFACVAKNIIIEMKDGVQYRRTLPTPSWTGAGDGYAYDYPFVTSIERAEGGRWWFAYGYARGLGFSDPGGRTRLVRMDGLPPIRHIARLGDDLFVGADGCVVARIRDLKLRGTDKMCSAPMAPRLVRTADALWALNGSTVVRRDAAGTSRRWEPGAGGAGVAYGRAAHVTYFIGSERSGRAVLVTLGADGVPRTARLPMLGGSSIAVDARGRIWISDEYDHSLVAIAPPGAWG